MNDVLSNGRIKQKQRTRTALIEAARVLLNRGASPTVEEAAAAAEISRTTAYRYFRNQAELIAALRPEIAKTSLLPANAPDTAEERLELVVREITRVVVEGEQQYRAMLRLSLDPATPPESLMLRQGRAIGWIDEALSPLDGRMSRSEKRRLVLAIRAAIGIEALVWLRDVAGQSRPEAVKTMRWSARTLLRGALGG